MTIRLTLCERDAKTVFGDRGQTDRVLTLTCDLQFQSAARHVSDPHTRTKDQRQKSVGSKEWKRTDGRTDRRMEAIALEPTSHANAVGNKQPSISISAASAAEWRINASASNIRTTTRLFARRRETARRTVLFWENTVNSRRRDG